MKRENLKRKQIYKLDQEVVLEVVLREPCCNKFLVESKFQSALSHLHKRLRLFCIQYYLENFKPVPFFSPGLIGIYLQTNFALSRTTRRAVFSSFAVTKSNTIE